MLELLLVLMMVCVVLTITNIICDGGTESEKRWYVAFHMARVFGTNPDYEYKQLTMYGMPSDSELAISAHRNKLFKKFWEMKKRNPEKAKQFAANVQTRYGISTAEW